MKRVSRGVARPLRSDPRGNARKYAGACVVRALHYVLPVKLWKLLRSGAAGLFATAVDLATLAILVTGFHVSAQIANVPALVAGGVANFAGNRWFAFRARGGSLSQQALGYTLVEVVALALNGWLFALALRLFPHAAHAYWAVRLVTSHLVFLTWSYPLWCLVFRQRGGRPALSSSRATSASPARSPMRIG